MIKFSILVISFLIFFQSQLFAINKESTLECGVIQPIMQAFLANHVYFRKMEPELETRTIEQYINRLDPSKSYLLESDVATIKTNLKGIMKKLYDNSIMRVTPDCASILAAQDILEKRTSEVEAFVRTFLSSPEFKFNENVELVVDPKLRNWSKNEKELKELTIKFLQFQISNYLATEMKLEDAKKQLIHRYELNVARQKKISPDEVYVFFLDAFATSLDAHSGFLGKDTLEDFEISMRLSLEGIGAALIWEDGYTTIDNLIPGGSAEKSGELQPKDKIIAVAQGEGPFENVIDMPLRDVVRLIRGKKGTLVRLSILRQTSKETTRLIVSLKRDKINLQDEAAKLTYTTVKDGDKNLKIAVIDLPSFYGDMQKQTRSCFDDMRKLVDQAKREKADGMILDLSRNGGGLLSEAVRIGGLFIKKGNIVATQDQSSKMEFLADEDEKVNWNGPLVVLTSRLSASASEIVSGALKDYHRALIVGADHTFGKGTVQAMMNLPRDLGAIKVTTGMFFIPGGNSTQYRGVTADVELPSIFSTKDIGESSLDYSLPAKSVSKFTSESANDADLAYNWNPVTPSLIEKLKGLSSARVEKNPEFKKIKEDLADLENSKSVVNLAKSMKKQKEEKAKEKKDGKKVARKGKRQSDEEYLKTPHVSESIQILADLIRMSSNNRQTLGQKDTDLNRKNN